MTSSEAAKRPPQARTPSTDAHQQHVTNMQRFAAHACRVERTSSIELLTAELPMLALTLVRKLRPGKGGEGRFRRRPPHRSRASALHGHAATRPHNTSQRTHYRVLVRRV
jgi:hypothetical protein